MNRIIFVGSQNIGKLLDDGETIKNAHLKQGLRKYVDEIIEIDVRNKPSRILYLIKFLLCLIFYRNSKIVMSASSLVAYKLFKIIKVLKWDMSKCYYWVIGGNFGNWIESGKFNKKIYTDLQAIIVEGNSMKEQLNRCGLSNVIQLPNMKPVKYIPKKKYCNEGKTKFIFLSRIIPEKGVNYIIAASNMLVNEGVTNFSVNFFGKMDEDYECEFLDNLKNSPNLSYCGFMDLSSNKGYDELAQYDVMLFPTYWFGEGFPGVIIDAFVAGLPVIASDWNLNKDLVEDGKTGFIIAVHDVVALKESMKNIINGNVNIKEMALHSQLKAHEFDLDNVVSEELLNSINIIS